MLSRKDEMTMLCRHQDNGRMIIDQSDPQAIKLDLLYLYGTLVT
jgi:hypothetical protein